MLCSCKSRVISSFLLMAVIYLRSSFVVPELVVNEFSSTEVAVNTSPFGMCAPIGMLMLFSFARMARPVLEMLVTFHLMGASAIGFLLNIAKVAAAMQRPATTANMQKPRTSHDFRD